VKNTIANPRNKLINKQRIFMPTLGYDGAGMWIGAMA